MQSSYRGPPRGMNPVHRGGRGPNQRPFDDRPTIIDRFIELCRNEKQKPFIDDGLLEDSPAPLWADLQNPRLRRCPLQHEMEWLERLGFGVDGIVWKVKIAGDTYALKIVSSCMCVIRE